MCFTYLNVLCFVCLDLCHFYLHPVITNRFECIIWIHIVLAGNFDDFSFVAFDVNSFPCGVYKHVLHIVNMDIILVTLMENNSYESFTYCNLYSKVTPNWFFNRMGRRSHRLYYEFKVYAKRSIVYVNRTESVLFCSNIYIVETRVEQIFKSFLNGILIKCVCNTNCMV